MTDNNYRIESGFLHREFIEVEVGRPITDEEWTDLTAEIEGRVDNFIDALLEDLIYDLAHKKPTS